MSKDILLDTCALIWLATGSKALSAQARTAIAKAPNVYVSSISAFEIAYKHVRGGLKLPCDPEQWFQKVLETHDIKELFLDSTVFIKAASLPLIHKDPCDRCIIATAMLKSLPVATGDTVFKKYGINIMG
jgi:PIN domain nuclease of toxin-antitoxin system